MPDTKKPSFDPGLTQRYDGVLRRAINPDGRFNVRRTGSTWRDAHPYLFLINASWGRFLVIVAITYVVVNTFFAIAYMAIGIEHLKGAVAATQWLEFTNAFFFSAHTLTTVGYGNMWPVGPAANTLAALVALAGLMTFAIATGLLFGRFSRPSARIGFSSKMLVAPYQDGLSLQFRVVNRRSNNLIDVESRLLLMTVQGENGKPQRKFEQLELERSQVMFFPLTWTVVHPITEASPLFGTTREDLEKLQAEVLVTMKAFDESFGQVVNSRFSYRYDDMVWGAKFVQSFEVEENGDLRLEIDRVGDYTPAPLPEAVSSSR
ncbi:MAG: ion channel [Bryobacteraceae bacterium]